MITRVSIENGNFSQEDADKYLFMKYCFFVKCRVNYEWITQLIDSIERIYKKYGLIDSVKFWVEELGFGFSKRGVFIWKI